MTTTTKDTAVEILERVKDFMEKTYIDIGVKFSKKESMLEDENGINVLINYTYTNAKYKKDININYEWFSYEPQSHTISLVVDKYIIDIEEDMKKTIKNIDDEMFFYDI